MAVHLGWYGTRGVDNSLPTPSPVTNSQVNAWSSSALDVYMSYGLQDQGSMATWKTDVNDILNNVIGNNTYIKLLLQIPAIAMNQIKNNQGTSYIDDVNSTYDGNSKVFGYYIEEPNLASNNWSPANVNTAKGRLGKPLVTNIRAEGATQQTYNDYAPNTDIISGFHYPLTTGSSKWQNIEALQGASAPLTYLKNTGATFWFAVQALTQGSLRQPVVDTWPANTPDVWAQNKKHSDELMWMMHRAIYAGAKGVLFYHFNRSYDDLHQAVFNMCDMMSYESANRAFETTPLASSASPDQNWVKLIDGTDIFYSYYYFSNSYWLLVMDAIPQTNSSPRNLVFQCKLGDQGGVNLFNNFAVLNQRYGVEQTDGRGTGIAASNQGGDKFKQFRAYNETDYDYRLKRGDVRMYRFKCGP